MGRALPTYTDRVRSILGDVKTATLSDPDAEAHILAAFRRFSTDSPRIIYADYAGNGSSMSFALPGTWQTGFSVVAGVEYPQGNNPPLGLDDEEVNLYPSGSEPTTIMLSTTTPATGQVARVYFTAAWPVPDNTTTTDVLPDVAYDPLCQLAASYAADQLAARSAGSTRVSGGTEIMQTNPEEQNWADVAMRALKRYTAFVAGSGDGGPASAWVTWDDRSSFVYQSGGAYLFPSHNRATQQ